MATITLPKILANFETSLASKISDSAAELTLNTSVDDDGNTLSGLYELTIDEGTNSEEHMFVTLTGAAGVITRRGLSRVDFWTEKTANKYEHTRGASVKITNFSLGNITRLLNGDDSFNSVDLSGINSIDGLALPVSNTEAASKQYVDNTATGSTYVDRIIVAGNAGEVVAAGELVYLDNTDTEWKLVDATDTATLYNVKLGIAQGAGVDGGAIANGILLSGLDSNQSGLAANNTAYATDVAGVIGSAAGTNEKIVGVILSATEVLFDPDYGPAPTADEKDALAGTSGSPSTANKYVTNDDTATTGASKVVRTKANSKLDDAVLALTTAGDTVYSDGTDLQRLGIGTAGQVLKTNDAATAPEWGSPSGIPGDANGYFTYQLSTVAATWTSVDATLTQNTPTYSTIASSADTWYSYATMAGVGSGIIVEFVEGKNFRSSFRARPTNGTTGDRKIGFGASSAFPTVYNSSVNDFVGFALDGGTLYAVTANAGVGATATDVSAGITETNWNTYRVEFDAGSEARFYVNETLVTTINTNLPDGANNVVWGAGGTTNTEDWNLSSIIISQEY